MTTGTAPKPQPYTGFPYRDDQRADYAAGLRHLADLIEAGSAPFPHGSLNFWPTGEPEEQPAAARDLMRAFGGGKYAKDADGTTMNLSGMCGGVPVRIWVARDAVCERVVVGTETVEVPAQPAVEAHTEVRDVIEWRCGSLLGAAEDGDTIEVAP